MWIAERQPRCQTTGTQLTQKCIGTAAGRKISTAERKRRNRQRTLGEENAAESTSTRTILKVTH